MTPGIPVITPDKPAGVGETYFQAMASALIYGARDAVLVDTFTTVKQANALADSVASKGKNLVEFNKALDDMIADIHRRRH